MSGERVEENIGRSVGMIVRNDKSAYLVQLSKEMDMTLLGLIYSSGSRNSLEPFASVASPLNHYPLEQMRKVRDNVKVAIGLRNTDFLQIYKELCFSTDYRSFTDIQITKPYNLHICTNP